MLYEIDVHTIIEIDWSAKSILKASNNKPCLAISLATQKKSRQVGVCLKERITVPKFYDGA